MRYPHTHRPKQPRVNYEDLRKALRVVPGALLLCQFPYSNGVGCDTISQAKTMPSQPPKEQKEPKETQQTTASQKRAFEGRDTLGGGFPQALHNRSREKGSELHKLLLGFCTATLGVYFIALTGDAKPPLSHVQKVAAVSGLLVMALGSLCGLAGMLADSRRNYFWACALQATDKDKGRRAEMYYRRDVWWRVERVLDRALVIAFLVGVLSSLVYMVLRILAK